VYVFGDISIYLTGWGTNFRFDIAVTKLLPANLIVLLIVMISSSLLFDPLKQFTKELKHHRGFILQFFLNIIWTTGEPVRVPSIPLLLRHVC